MHLLYLDDSGAVANPADRHVVLAGLAVFERQTHWLSKKLDELAERIWPEDPFGLEFRGADMLGGKRRWRGIEREVRRTAFAEALGFLGASKFVRIFGAVVHKAAVAGEDPLEHAFEQICNRFDRYLGRLHHKGDTQRGVIVLDESAYETSLQSLAHEFRREGHRWGKLRNLSEVPLFVNSRATRMVQYADLIAYALRRYYEKGEGRWLEIVAERIDAEGGVLHGLTHRIPAGEACGCLACSRRPRQPGLPF